MIIFQAPVVHSVSIESKGDAKIDVSDFIESEYCQISSQDGPVQVNRIKTESLTVTTDSGEILCSGHIQGSVKISSNSGSVVGEQRFIGPTLDISTDSGDIRVASSYSDQVKMQKSYCTLENWLQLRSHSKSIWVRKI